MQTKPLILFKTTESDGNSKKLNSTFGKYLKSKQYHAKVLLNSFHLNGHTLAPCTA